MPTIRIGTASPATGATRAATLAHIAGLARRAAAQRIDVLVLPEALVGGYPRGAGFGSVVGARSEAGRDDYARYFDGAADLGDTAGAGAGERWVRRELPAANADDDDHGRGDGTREALEAAARDAGVLLVVGCVEKAGGSLYCAVVYVCPRGGVLGKRRKVMATGSERLVWAQGSASSLRAVSTTIRGARVNMAAAICWENYMPLLRQSLYAQNVNLYLAPTADGRDAWLALVRTIAVEGRCFVVSSMCVRDAAEPDAAPEPGSPGRRRRRRRKSVFDEDGNEIVLRCDDDAADDASAAPELRPDTRPPDLGAKPEPAAAAAAAAAAASRGGSCIVSPFGDVLAGPQWDDDEGIVFADVDLRDCIRGRLDLDTAGSYSRSDSFHLTVQGLDLDPLPY